ncbi:MAG: response regulator [Lachnospiraceae bacterium]|nr:response regulator [Lachnospiraceae bacterium]
MIQKKFLCSDLQSAESAVEQIKDIISRTKHKSALITFYETGFSKNEIGSLIGRMKAFGLKELQIAGISLIVVAELMHEKTGLLLNLILTEEADIEVVKLPCLPRKENEAVQKLRSRLSAHDNVRALEFLCSNMKLRITSFMEKAMEGYEDVVLFGTATTKNLLQKVSIEEEENIVEKVSEDMLREEFVAGDEIIPDGVVAVIFAGENLKVRANYALGWKPIGRSFPTESSADTPIGETVVTKVNDLPAVDIYREYLGVYPDPFFISNICEFPLVVERGGFNTCLIPLDMDKNGELYFMMSLHPGEKLRFSFASHDEVLGASRESLESMECFGPEALFLTLCGNRLNFLKNDAHIEWDSFADVAPDYVLMHGAGELFYHHGKGGILNSAHLAIGLREADASGNIAAYEHPSVESLRRGRTLSLSDRMSTFLDKITSELIDTATEAQDANRAKSVFLSHMSHEIRTPINAILGMDEMILKESRESGTLEYADSIRSAGNNLLGIVNDILDFSKIEAGRMNIVPVEYELMSVVRDMYNVVRLRAEDKGLKVKLDIDKELPAVLFGDSARIKQVIANILTNAVKYTETGTVTFVVKKVSDGTESDMEEFGMACPVESEQLTGYRPVKIGITVRDTGIGIKPADMERLFEEYERFDEKRNRTIEGTGLGLSITRELLELMGSRLSVKSTYGVGSEFGFEILQGVAGNEKIGDIEGGLKKPAGQKKRVRFTAEDAKILVVDDTEINLMVVKQLLKRIKIKIDTAASGEEALALVKENAYDIIFLDHLMPDMDGPETLKKMNELENNRSAGAPVISLTSNALPNAREEYIKIGYKDYLLKPFLPESLENMLFYYIPPEKIRTLPSED